MQCRQRTEYRKRLILNVTLPVGESSVAVPLIVNIRGTVSGAVFRKYIGHAMVVRGSDYHGTAVFRKFVDISVDLHDALIELSRIAGKVPGIVSLDPASAHDAVITKVVPLVIFPQPGIAVVGAVAVLIFIALGRVYSARRERGEGICGCQRQSEGGCGKIFFVHVSSHNVPPWVD